MLEHLLWQTFICSFPENTMEDVTEEYRNSLADLTQNSKPLINMLTMLAEDNEIHAAKIVQVIETHLQEV